MTARLATPKGALGFGVLTLAVLAAGIPLSHLAHQSLAAPSFGPLPIAFGVVGLVVAYRRPENPIGWCFLIASFLIAVDDAASAYAVAVYREHSHLPLGRLAVFLQPSWAPAIVLFGVGIQLFPNGRFPQGDWRFVLWGFLVLGALWYGGALGIVAAAEVHNTVHITAGGDLVQLDHPTGSAAWWGWVEAAFFIGFGLSVLAWLARELPAYRRATGEQRQQLKWLLAGAVIAAIGGALTMGGSGDHGIPGLLGSLGTVAITALPISVGIGILRFRLYEIDRLISRTISYAIVTGSLVAVFLGVIVVTTHVLPFSSPVGVAASTLVAAALFNPLRRRVQRIVDRRFNRARYDAEATVEAFSLLLRDSADIETVRESLIAAVDRAVQPAQLGVWIRGTE